MEKALAIPMIEVWLFTANIMSDWHDGMALIPVPGRQETKGPQGKLAC